MNRNAKVVRKYLKQREQLQRLVDSGKYKWKERKRYENTINREVDTRQEQTNEESN